MSRMFDLIVSKKKLIMSFNEFALRWGRSSDNPQGPLVFNLITLKRAE
jgi:hypothetical protein